MGAVSVAGGRPGPIRVMLVEDSAVVRGMVRQWLDAIAGVEVVQAAGNGQIAINQVQEADPDIILLDIEMPVMDGMTALPELLRLAPRAKVILASTLSRRNAEVTLRAMSMGAHDYVAKPSFVRQGNDARAEFEAEIVRKVRGLAGLQPRRDGQPGAHIEPTDTDKKGVGRWGAGAVGLVPMPVAGQPIKLRKPSAVPPRALVIGSSTGGPAALARIVAEAGPALRTVPVFIAQHMPPTFTALLGEKLAGLAGIEGGEAVHGAPVVPGRLYVAPGGHHMSLKRCDGGIEIQIEDGPPINHCKPSVEPLFQSAAELYGASTLCAILTGMGHDGVEGVIAIANAGGTVIAQDEASSVVWGMPGAAAAAGACSEIVALQNIGLRLSRALGRRAVA